MLRLKPLGSSLTLVSLTPYKQSVCRPDWHICHIFLYHNIKSLLLTSTASTRNHIITLCRDSYESLLASSPAFEQNFSKADFVISLLKSLQRLYLLEEKAALAMVWKTSSPLSLASSLTTSLTLPLTLLSPAALVTCSVNIPDACQPQDLAFAVPSTWDTLPPDICTAAP